MYEINADIVRQVERRSELVRDRGSVELIGTYDQTIMNLQNERNIAREYKRYMQIQICAMTCCYNERTGDGMSKNAPEEELRNNDNKE